MLRRSLAATGLTLMALTTLTACSERPSESEISDSFLASVSEDEAMASMLDEDQMREFADCVAEILHDSEISDETLKAAVEDPESLEDSDSVPEADQKILDSAAFEEDVMGCLQDFMGEMTGGAAGTFEEGTDPQGMDTE